MMIDPQEIAILAGLLDFYSDRATAHASFVVAVTLGMYTVLFQAVMLRWLIFVIVYIALVFSGLYCFMNFRHYAILSYVIKGKLERRYKEKTKREIDARTLILKVKEDREIGLESLKKRNIMIFLIPKILGLIDDKFGSLKKSKILKHVLLFSLWSLAVLLPFLWKVRELWM